MDEAVWGRMELLLKEIAPRVLAYRRELHRIPEESFQEFQTTAYLEKTLSGLSAATGAKLSVARPAATGLVATLAGGGGPGPMVGLRADIDALRQREETGCGFASLHPGFMHACGHDGHMAMLLGVAEALMTARDSWAGEARFIFQRAEELHPGGARELAAAGCLDGLDFALATHLWATLPVGTIGLTPGPFMAAPDNFILTLRGRGGHAAMPDKTVDPVAAGAHVILALQTMLTRQIDPLRSVVLSVTGMTGGDTYNIIPDEVRLKGTLRVFTEELRPLLREKIAATAGGISAAFGAECTAEFIEGYDVVNNDAALTAKLGAVFARALPEVSVRPVEPLMCGEDFSVYQKYAPGVFFLTGAGNPAVGAVYPQHHAKFQIDENSLTVGLRALTAGALALLAPAN
ncbi:MAG: amidohydrolase [Gracilibacteraceae bacterium]|jgi:amidohydrolase|nr:amidohydrolase [Gracilibacteraceae bacterium]